MHINKKKDNDHFFPIYTIIITILGLYIFFLSPSARLSGKVSLNENNSNFLSIQNNITPSNDISEKSIIEKKDLEIDRLKKYNHTLFIIFIFTLSFFTLLFFIILYKRYLFNKKMNSELKKAYIQMEKLATYDPLTHLYNRRSMTERIEIEIVRMGRTGKPFCLIMFDIDDFQKYNNLYGNECGDKILESLSIILKESIRNQDAASRWGGEEFLVLLPETGGNGGYIAAEKIRKRIETATMEYGEYKIQFTITAGISVYDKPGSVNDCIRAADMAMYKGKKDGKNRIIR
jgi:diguanylate cyclase (GGDEF)-like protein